MSKSTAASIITSGQNRDFDVCAKSELATIKIFAYLSFTASYAAKIVSSFLYLHPTISLNIDF